MTAAMKSSGAKREPMGATPPIAATFAAGTAYMWAEAVIRALATNTTLGGWYFIYPERTGDVVAIWVTAVVASLVVFLLSYALFRGKPRVGSLRLWTAIFTISVILAPLVGELGTPIGI